MTPEARLAALGLTLPEPPRPHGDYQPVAVHGGIALVSGQLSREGDGVVRGPVGPATAPETLARAGRACTLRALSALRHELGGLHAVERVLHLRGFVNAEPAFEEHSRVLDTVSRLLHDVFGERGRHARTAVGVSSLPSRGLLEIELTLAVARRKARPACAGDSG
ncbi:RidA family protein [Streptomyces sp. NPDC021225]|uniref:RidA family protein n=1 Tax=Streptomyces sp. NPDC021225 TaxID=3365121 RepID=UPI0037915991